MKDSPHAPITQLATYEFMNHSTDARRYSVHELLRDGGSVHVRSLCPDDAERLREHFHTLSPRSVYTRFFGPKKELTPAELSYFTDMDGIDKVGLVATLLTAEGEKIIGVGLYFRLSAKGQPHCAEVAFAVSDGHQRRGIASVLLEHLARIARSQGIVEFAAEVLGENNQMMQVFSRSGFKVSRSAERGVFHVTFPTAETPSHEEVTLERARQAAAESVRPLLAPASVAIVGASRDETTIGGILVRNLLAGGFRGRVYPVNPHAEQIQGLPAFARVSEIGEPVDLAVVATPAATVLDVVADCARAGVRGIVVISAGFGEINEEGAARQRELLALVRGSGMRMIGPNCMGVVNTDPEVLLNATFAPGAPPAGSVAMLSQSGALGLAILDLAGNLGIGLSSFVSVGNKADVSGNDLLSYWAEDPRTNVILLYLESFGNPRKFARIAPRVARVKPIVAVKSGRSPAGRRAASSHSASLASLDIAVDTLFEQCGVIRTDTMSQLFDVASLLATQPVPAGARVGVITNAGGPGILLADACEARGLVLPELAPETRERLAELLPPQSGLSNPVDLLAAATPEQYARAIEIVGNDPCIDSLVVICIPVLSPDTAEIARAIARAAASVPAGKPVLANFLSSSGAPHALSQGPRGAIPSFAFPEDAALALSAAARYGRWRRRPAGTCETLKPFARDAVRAVLERVLKETGQPCWLGNEDVRTVLRAAGIAFAESVDVAAAEAVAAAGHLQYPLVIKVSSPAILHKSDAGAVIMGVTDDAAAAAAMQTLESRMQALGQPLERVLLQRQIRGGIECVVGVTVDPDFGPLVVAGAGGVLVEMLGDVSFHLAPVSDVDAEEMLDRLKTRRLFDGYRGAPPADRAALVQLILRVSALVEAAPEIVELDLNPIKVLAPGEGAVVVDARMRVAPLG
jgi:acetyl coenzyme A synthetase (ADP forming)-like protein